MTGLLEVLGILAIVFPRGHPPTPAPRRLLCSQRPLGGGALWREGCRLTIEPARQFNHHSSMRTEALYNPENRTFTMSRGIWSATYPIAELQKWIDFYRRQQERFPAQAAIYGESLKALTDLRDSI